MKITEAEVEHVAHLARLMIDRMDMPTFILQFNGILEYIDKLNELDTKDIKPTSHILPIKNILKEDSVSESLPADEALANGPEKESGHFKVPKIV